MALILNCQRCGGKLPPMSEDDEKLLRSGKPIVLKHDVCPDQRAELEAAKPRTRRFEARVRIVEVIESEPAPEQGGMLLVPGTDAPMRVLRPGDVVAETVELAGFTAWVDAANLNDAMRPLANELGTKWMEVEQHAPLVDTPDLSEVETVED